MSQRLELKDTKKHKTHNIQPQHEHGGTRVSGSSSNLSVSSGTSSDTSERAFQFWPMSIVAKRLDGLTRHLGTEVDLGPGHFVLDGFPAIGERGTAAPSFRPMPIVATVAHRSYC